MKTYTKINLIFIILFTFLVSSCSLIKPSSRDKAMASERRDNKAAAKEMKALEKAHFKNQPPDTRKMMKKSKRRAKERNKIKKWK
ncbi:MAG: hypothetical protein CVU14_02415 [Bacteroidetes bacterium HGW-Bacteroidetes-9]|jgi:hypothetical protein|nr:MAG: hypothetical protein CVU14_02415 [Bacteroidetes bacterium HGW-Bacteroidetes-9]